MASLGTFYGPNAGSDRFRVGVDVQYDKTDATKGYHVQYRGFIDVLKTAQTQTYFTEYMRVSWNEDAMYKCGDKTGRVGQSAWIDGAWVKPNGSYTIPAVSCWYYPSSGGTFKSELTGKSVKVPGELTFTVEFSANGGTGGPSTITGETGKSVTIPSTKPTRTGYKFAGWSTQATGTAEYQPGDKITKSTKLYAVWSVNTYTVDFDANGGTGAPGRQIKEYGKALKISSTIPTRENFTFLGWSKVPNGDVVLKAGSNYTSNKDLVLYAVWDRKVGGYAKFSDGWAQGLVYQKFSDGWAQVEPNEKNSANWGKLGV